MLIRRDFDLNSVDMYTDSARVYTESLVEVFRETMLRQEIVFQKQVHELHRLYRMQKTLMQNNSWMEFDQYNLNKVGLTHSGSQGFLEGCQDVFHKLQQRPLGHELPAKYYTSHVDTEDLKLSLRIGEDNGRKQRAKRTLFDAKMHPFSQNVIDLEESSETTSNEDSGNASPFSCAALTVKSGSKYESQNYAVTDPIIPSSGLKKDQSHVKVENCSFVDDHERSSNDQDLERCDVNVLNKKLSTKLQQISSYGKWELDLNKVCCDDSSCYSNDPIMSHPSTASSSHAFLGLVGRVEEGSFRSKVWSKEYNNCSGETSGIIHPDDAGNSVLENSNSIHERTGICPESKELCGSEVVRSPFEEFGCNKNDSDDANIGYRLETLKSQTSTRLAIRAVNHEKGESEDDVLSYSDHSKNIVQDACGNTSSASCKPCHVGDNESSNGETMQAEVELGNSLSIDRLSGNEKRSQAPATLCGEQNLKSSDSSEFKHEYLSKEESDKVVDSSVHMAAESLILFFLESSACYQDCSMKDAESTEMEANERAMPQSSCDSFELLTLKLKECSEYDTCVSSKPPEVNFTEKKDYGFKIRRGRRLKDFQRDILPGLASLSRQEIREDINILEGVLRSREYRKIQAKMADVHGWCTPARSRRSRLKYTARRRFS
ncbi:hypothetical protein TorRG33x02_112550 [Trema orientale]|uniref:Uncharacterized protein n=1 Tax=Trema orientale TaxID=63057 RepID=A0A2P5F5A7_TREOI|nr:hypothetical protein TorRG33x02_112550 [Trema orientale]